ncbi:non-homologous end joining protein Ku [Auraticoccus monumenti]|uniref:Non-homologous end joining protein Ku n=1 Tax=Auraticoccus monumenti TaxID=675864 RepID=A0A1G7AHH4_9ACTN|nr:Ku protein [Auraticoccus monumenti]SDE13505.1 DNA end-binding protein Ku [Auraticoccus monumenti]
MPRSIWKGAISFGLISIPIKVYGATEQKDISFRQVHPADGGRIKYKRVCEVCSQEIPFAEIAKGYETPDGRMAILEKQDFEDLPLRSTKAVDVVQFVDADEVDPTYISSTYFLEADGPGAKPYVLLRDALVQSGRVAIVKVALRSRETLAMIRAKDDLLLMHTILWPDELRDGQFAAPAEDVSVSDAEITMAGSFIDALSGPFEPEQFHDAYREALETLVEAKLSGSAMVAQEEDTGASADVVDLVAALRASVEAAKKRRAEASGEQAAPAAPAEPAEEEDEAPARKTPTRTTAKKTTAKKTAAKKTTAAKTTTARKTPAKKAS